MDVVWDVHVALDVITKILVSGPALKVNIM